MHRRLHLASVLLFAVCSLVIADEGGPPEVPDEATRAMYEEQAKYYASLLSKTYELSPEMSAQVESEFMSLVDEQVRLDPLIRAGAWQVAKQYEAEYAKHGEGWVPSEEDRKRIEAPVNDAWAKQPLDIEKLRAKVESRLPAGQVRDGRARFLDVERQDSLERMQAVNDQTLQQAAYDADVRDGREAHRLSDANTSPAGNPMPKAEFVPPAPPPPPPSAVKVQPAVVTPAPPPKARPVVPEMPRQEPAARVEPPIPPPPLQPAPPVDEWDRHVDAVAQKYKFSSDQKSKGQGILKDLRDRARQYRKSHSADFEAASRMQPGADRVAEEKRLSQPLDELFAELKERLEHLPTQEQRDAAGVKPKK